jgi:Domain of unknown function (DUF6249)
LRCSGSLSTQTLSVRWDIKPTRTVAFCSAKTNSQQNATGSNRFRSHHSQGRKSLQMVKEDSMSHLITILFGAPDMPEIGLWLFLSVASVSLFAVFIPLVTWIGSRQKEREAFYKADTIRRIAEASSDGAKATIDLLREENRMTLIKIREGLKISGVICIGVGIGLVAFLSRLVSSTVALCGLIPGLIGLAMLVYVYFMAAPVE